MNLNKVFFGGYITRDPELRYLASGTAVCEVSVAANYSQKKDGKEYKEVCFLPCIFWGKRAELVGERFHKGDPILIEGRLKTESWEKDGNKRTAIKMQVENFHFVGAKKDNAATTEQKQASENPSSEEDIPF